MAQSVLRDAYPYHLSSLSRRCRQETKSRMAAGKETLAQEWQQLLTNGVAKNRAELARRKGVSRARVTQVIGIM